MEFTSMTAIVAILQIIFIDLLLAGDNAIVIGMAAKNLPLELRSKAITWGTVGAIAIRIIMAFLFVEALEKIPALHLIGGLLLLWIGYSLLVKKDGSHDIAAKPDLKGAILTIVLADGIMGIDNVLGVVGAAGGHMGMVVVGMLITVPIIVWGSSFFVKVIDKYPVVLYAGAAVLGWVGAGMIVMDPLVYNFLKDYKIIFSIFCAVIVIIAGICKNMSLKKIS